MRMTYKEGRGNGRATLRPTAALALCNHGLITPGIPAWALINQGYVEMVSNNRRRQFSELSREDVTVRKLVRLQVITLHTYPSF